MTTPVPFYFGPDGGSLFGWLHAAAPGPSADFGVVVCNPFGFEEVCAHRSLRHLADATAAAGIPSLRFDYAGCGNSLGDEFEPGRFASWIHSLHLAADQLKVATGVTRVCLVGVRLGAALAALAATDRDDVVGLVAIAPVVRGREYLRELRMLGGSVAASSDNGALESAGFLLSAQSVDALGRIDLRAATRAPAPRVLIVERDDLDGNRHWHDALVQAGAATETVAWPGYAAVMTNPQDAQLPTQIIDGVLATLAGWRTGGAPAPAADAAARRTEIRHQHAQAGGQAVALSERAVSIDVGGSALFGVLTQPAAPARDTRAKRRGIVMLNSGSVHHIGPNRLWTVLARRWAARGVTVLRIDLSGIGDSAPRVGRPENRVYSIEAADDIAAALGCLREHGVDDCQLVGLCSGAFHALNAAVAGQAISAALVINPLTYSWEDCSRLGSALNEYEILELSRKYRRQLLSANTWQRFARGELDLKMIAGVVARRGKNSARELLSWCQRGIGLASNRGLGANLSTASQHGIPLRFVFAEGAPGHEMLWREAARAVERLRAKAQLSIDLVADADHTFTRIDARERLIAALDALLFPQADLASLPVNVGASAMPAAEPARAEVTIPGARLPIVQAARPGLPS